LTTTDGELEPCAYVVDSAGLHEIVTTQSNNLKSLYLDRLERGIIGVPTIVWDEFEEAYDDEAELLKPHIARKIRARSSFKTIVATIADRTNASFSMSPYDRSADMYAAAVAIDGGHTVLTTIRNAITYDGMGCEVIDLTTWASEQ
jgi:hypothetical protein